MATSGTGSDGNPGSNPTGTVTTVPVAGITVQDGAGATKVQAETADTQSLSLEARLLQLATTHRHMVLLRKAFTAWRAKAATNSKPDSKARQVVPSPIQGRIDSAMLVMIEEMITRQSEQTMAGIASLLERLNARIARLESSESNASDGSLEEIDGDFQGSSQITMTPPPPSTSALTRHSANSSSQGKALGARKSQGPKFG